jgi:hypothetical protein
VSRKCQFGRTLWHPSLPWALILAFGCTLLLALFPAAGQAAPEGDATIRIAAFTVQEGTAGGGQAICPPGSRVVGGGVTRAAGPPLSDIRASGPLDETGLPSDLTNGDVGQSWDASVYNFGSGPITFVATAICSPGSDATLEIEPFTVDPATVGPTGAGRAVCPPGSRVIGGGVTGVAATVSEVRAIGPLDETGLTSNLADGDVGQSWYSQVSSTTANTFVSTAICSPGSDATIRTDPFTLQQDQTGDGQAFCPTGTRVVGGGVTATGDTTSIIQASGPLDETGRVDNLADGQVGRSWYASVRNLGVGQNSYVATAICSPPSNRFNFGKLKRNKKKGTATLTVDVPGPGKLVLSGKGLVKQRPADAFHASVLAKAVSAAGKVKLKVRSKGKKRRKLNRTGKVKVKAKVTYTPTGGTPNTRSKTIRLVKK